MKQHCSALVDLSDFGWAAANHLDTVEANGLDATTTFVDCFNSGTTTEFCVPDHRSQAAIMVKFRAVMPNPDLFRTAF